MRKIEEVPNSSLRAANLLECTADEARILMDEMSDAFEELLGALDQAQGDAKMSRDPQYVMLRIVPE
jgi:hypothetical protein